MPALFKLLESVYRRLPNRRSGIDSASHSLAQGAYCTPYRRGEHAVDLLAYTRKSANIVLQPCSARRGWMEKTSSQFANRCLPLRIANQCGWALLNPSTVQATWNGGVHASDISIVRSSFDESIPEPLVSSHFGHGILTWTLPVLFRTSPGYNLWVRGPANQPKDAVQPLEGIVETDWSVMTFTVNWIFTRAETPVTFREGESLCVIVPFPRFLLENVAPRFGDIADNASLANDLGVWEASRRKLNSRKNKGLSPPSEWQKDYYLGRAASGTTFADHQTTLSLRAFEWD